MRKILVIGANGQVGWELLRTLAPLGTVIETSRDPAKTRLDLADPEQIRATIQAVEPQIIVNAAAYTAVDRAEEEADQAMAINATAPGILAEEAKRRGALLIHYSTDYVYDGTKDVPYQEEDATNPQGVYGRSKLAGDEAIQAVGGNYLIFRTSWVYGGRGKNFLLTILRLIREGRNPLRIVGDQFGSPTWARMIAETTAQTLAGRDLGSLGELSGIYNLSSTGETSWHGFAQQIAEWGQALFDLPPVEVQSIATHEYPTPARRPAYSVLDGGKLATHFGVAMPDWQIALRLCLEDLAACPA